MSTRNYLFVGSAGVGKTQFCLTFPELFPDRTDIVIPVGDRVHGLAQHGTVQTAIHSFGHGGITYNLISTVGVDGDYVLHLSRKLYESLRLANISRIDAVCYVQQATNFRECVPVLNVINLLQLLMPFDASREDFFRSLLLTFTFYTPNFLPLQQQIIGPNGLQSRIKSLVASTVDLPAFFVDATQAQTLNDIKAALATSPGFDLVNDVALRATITDLNQQVTLLEASREQLAASITHIISSFQEYAGGAIPIGTVITSSCVNIPPGFLPCDGSLLQTCDYPKLFAEIGTIFGGNGVTSFRVPDLQGKVILGAGTSSSGAVYHFGSSGGSEKRVLKLNQLPPHNHSYKHELWLGGAGLASGGGHGQVGWNQKVDETATTGSGQPFSIMQPYAVLRHLIKAK